jgi:agmatinase
MSLEDAKTQIDLAFTRKGRRGLAYENAFSGATSFMRRAYSKDIATADLVVTGIPFDQAVTHRPGTRFGPRAIREASTLQPYDPPYGWDGFDPLSEFEIVDYGDMAFDYANVAGVPDLVQNHIKTIISQGPATVTLGGDHFITLPILRAYAEKYGPLSVIQFDAHSDLWADDDMSRIDHGTFMYKAVKLGLVDVTRSVQIGIRTECVDYLGMPYIDARTVHDKGATYVSEKVKEIVGDAPTYVTFDIDALDPAFAPGTGTPVWGGLASWQVAAILRDLAGINMVGGDIVEVSPPYDLPGNTALTGANLMFEILSILPGVKFR